MRRFLSRPRPAPFRPRLEELEGRCVPNASRVVDAFGQLHLFVVLNDGSLTRSDPGGATVLFAGGVSWAQAYLDPSGQLGFNVVFGSSHWVVYDAAGSHDMGSNAQGLDSVSTAFDPSGQKVLDVVQFDFHVGGVEWIQYDAAGAHVLFAGGGNSPNSSQDAENASTAFDAAGHQVSDYLVETFFFLASVGAQSVHGQWHENNPSGTFTKGGGQVGTTGFPNAPPSSGEALRSVLPSFDATGALAYDIVHANGEWDYYDAQGAHFMGVNVL
jgi:hypothetical protein